MGRAICSLRHRKQNMGSFTALIGSVKTRSMLDFLTASPKSRFQVGNSTFPESNASQMWE